MRNMFAVCTKAFLGAPLKYIQKASIKILFGTKIASWFIHKAYKKLSRRKGPKVEFNFQDRLSSKIGAKVG